MFELPDRTINFFLCLVGLALAGLFLAGVAIGYWLG